MLRAATLNVGFAWRIAGLWWSLPELCKMVLVPKCPAVEKLESDDIEDDFAAQGIRGPF
jgi:hypothetical protein